MVEVKSEISKVKPASDYPIEDGDYIRGNDFSPAAVVVMLNAPREEGKEIPPEVEKLVRVTIETGAALAGTLQTENTGIEKMICNIVANPNIRYLVLCGKEIEGHQTGSAIKGLMENGIDDKRTIIGSNAVTPYLFNVPLKAIKRFREQITLIDLLNEIDPEKIKKVVWSCYQEKPTKFMNYDLYDLGAYHEPPISCGLTWKIKHPELIEDWEIDENFTKKLED